MGKCNWVAVAAAAAAVVILAVAGRVEGRSDYGKEVTAAHISGKVLCQDCNQGWAEWIDGKPIKGAKVAVTCMDCRGRVVYHGSDFTDEKGEFELKVVRQRAYGKAIEVEDCTVRLEDSSPDSTCNVRTDFGGGRSGVRPHDPSAFQSGLVKYTVGPFYFTPPDCDYPDASNPLGDGDDD
ncbi:pistil-specific extensin-like protein [Zingiber officinale]|uniref:Pollen Ole e 1 allergen and extensin family protein n=1 Tax=Zingiber officinale TaxID=94328 RepID=A0A8J5IDW5_ZINOF|nr:pistil-specific extensin-like protein [Zingiber officinale]KAG6538675.1 hypothetical protein ZIOFF_003803 [Zingiber officinale]